MYADLKPTIKKLVENDRINKTNNAGELFLHILEYVTDKNPEAINFIVDVSFEPIKQQLKRDLVKFEEVKGKRSDAGKASAEARKLAKLQEQNLTNSTSVKSVQQTSTNSTVNDNDSVNVNDSVINKDIISSSTDKPSIDWDKFLTSYNNIFNKQRTVINQKVKSSIIARLKEGYTSKDIYNAMVAVKNDSFHKENGYKHATLEYFSRSKTLDMHQEINIQPKKQLNQLTPDVIHMASGIPTLKASLIEQGYTLAQIEGKEL